MCTFLIILFCIFFTTISIYHFNYGLFFLFLLLPTYLIRFHIGSLPTTLLEIMIWILLIVEVIKYKKSLYNLGRIILNLKSLVLNHKLLFLSILIFLTATTISIFTSSNLRGALGEWKAFYIEPVLLFLIIITVYNTPLTPLEGGVQLSGVSEEIPPRGGQGGVPPMQKNNVQQYNNNRITTSIISALLISGLATSLLAIYQHFTGFLVPDAFWANNNSYRVTAWYGFPNAVGLFLAPLVPLALYMAKQKWDVLKKKSYSIKHITNNKDLILLVCYMLVVICYMTAIFYAKSTGGIIGVVAGIGLLLIYYKKTRWPSIMIGIIGLLSILSLSSFSSLKQEILFQDRSGQIRLSIYKETANFLKDHPLTGAGLASYSEKIKPYHTPVNGEGVEIFHHPHNIFLTMWVNLGLLGLIGFVLILISFFKIGISHITYHVTHNNVTIGQYNNETIFLLSSMTVLITTGLVDSPYIKNDLAILFWTIVAMLIYTINKSKSSTR